jgi:hypothetical protein
MNLLYWPPNLPSAAVKAWWTATFGGEVFWPWFTLIGTTVTLTVAWGVAKIWPEKKRGAA